MIGSQQPGERFFQVGSAHLVIDDPEAGEHSLVELPADLRRCAEVQPMSAPAQQKDFVHAAHDRIALHLAALDGLARARHVAGDPLLLGLEQVEWDGIGVTGFQQLLPLVVQLFEAPLLTIQLRGVAGLVLRQLVGDLLPDLGDLHFSELDTAPPVGDRRLDHIDEHRGLCAVLLLGPPQAVEVRVDGAPAVAGVTHP
ncbi:hypothetical protein ABZ769_11345 [Streptomyces olivoreticuli]